MSLNENCFKLKQACRLPDEALLFLAALGRLEYALAKLGYGENGPYGLYIDRDRFCDERYRDKIHDVILDRDVAPNFRASPPLIAGVDQGHFAWLPRRPSSHPRDIIRALWNFRFQLYAPSVLGDAYCRNLGPMSSEALDIINVILDHDKEISELFFNNAEAGT